MSDNVLKTIQSILQDIIAPDIREMKAQQAAMQQQIDFRFKAMEEQMSHLEKQLLSAFATSQLQVELTGTKAIVDLRERVAVLESQRESQRAA